MSATAFRAIRAFYDDDCITVYQAYNSTIAQAAVETQKLSSSPLYRPGRATWIKPSWCWLMYRSGYSYKDSNQERILALKMKHENFLKLLRNASPAGSPHAKGETVVVQWDPERGPRLERLEHRSIQIGIPGAVRDQWIEEWIESIEDVTQIARDMKKKLDEDPSIGAEELMRLGLIPEERLYVVDDEIIGRLEMSR